MRKESRKSHLRGQWCHVPGPSGWAAPTEDPIENPFPGRKCKGLTTAPEDIPAQPLSIRPKLHEFLREEEQRRLDQVLTVDELVEDLKRQQRQCAQRTARAKRSMLYRGTIRRRLLRLEDLNLLKSFFTKFYIQLGTIQYPAQARLCTCSVHSRDSDSFFHAFTLHITFGSSPVRKNPLFWQNSCLRVLCCTTANQKNDKGNFKTRVANIVNGQGPVSSHIILGFSGCISATFHHRFSRFDDEMCFLLSNLLFWRETEREKTNVAELQQLQATTE